VQGRYLLVQGKGSPKGYLAPSKASSGPLRDISNRFVEIILKITERPHSEIQPIFQDIISQFTIRGHWTPPIGATLDFVIEMHGEELSVERVSTLNKENKAIS
jgi:hypothetical protein